MSGSAAGVDPLSVTAAQQTRPPTSFDRSLVLWLTNVSHAINHFQSHMVAVLYPVIMVELGFGYAQLGVLTAVQTMFGSATQGIYGFLAPFATRTKLLGLGNLVLGAGTLLTGLVGSFGALVGARAISSTGSSAQHPVGASLLSGYFPNSRGTILALNNSVAGIGSLLAPASVGFLLLVLGWRQIFIVFAFASLAMAAVYFLIPERVGGPTQLVSKRARLVQMKASYWRVLRNRNMLVISLVMMVGAAGRNDGANITYIGSHLVNDLAFSLALAGTALSVLQVGGMLGPLALGWLSDRVSRTGVIQGSLLLSAIATWWLASQGAEAPILLLNLAIYGAVTHSRNTLTQALVADSLSDEDRDAAFSSYYFIGFISAPIWAIATGFIMEASGFSVAFTVLGLSYIAGCLLLFFLEKPVTEKNSEPTGLLPG